MIGDRIALEAEAARLSERAVQWENSARVCEIWGKFDPKYAAIVSSARQTAGKLRLRAKVCMIAAQQGNSQ